jgi:hypothetical protein
MREDCVFSFVQPTAQWRPMRRTVLLGIGAVGIGGLLPGGSRPATAGAATEFATLFEEAPDSPTGDSFAGTVMWRVEQVGPGIDTPRTTVVKAEVDIPERQMRMTSTLARNLDRSLPASHIIDFFIRQSAGNPDHDIRRVSALEMRESAYARGTPLVGLTVKVTSQFFLTGLSDRDKDVERNVRMLKELPWLAVPMLYENDRRATLAFAKGETGTRALAAAFAAWEKPAPPHKGDRPDDRPIRPPPFPAEIIEPPADVIK